MTFNFELFNQLVARENEELKRLEGWQRDAYAHEHQMMNLKKHFKDDTPMKEAKNRIDAVRRDIREVQKRLDMLWLIRELTTTEEDPSK